MPGLSSSMNIGLTGLQAAQQALNIVGHNIANVNTEGYTRQRAVLGAKNAQTFGTLQFGTGVSLNNIMGMRDRFLDMQITQSISREKGASARYESLEGISTIFNDQTEAGLAAQIQKFFTGLQELAKKPEDSAMRTNLVGVSKSLVDGLKSRYQSLSDQQDAEDRTIGGLVKEVNTLTAQIAELNVRIGTEASPGSDNDSRDQRKQLLDKLAGIVGIQVFEDGSGRVNVTLDGGLGVLVSGPSAYTMTATADPALSNHYRIEVGMGGATPTDVTQGIKQGEMGARLDLRDRILPGYQAKLDQLAAGLASGVNLLHRAGFALDGVTTGLDFFQGGAGNQANGLPVGVSAATNYLGMVNALSVNAAIAANPSLIAAAGAAGAPGDNTQARAMAALQTATSSVDGNGDGVGDTGPFSTFVAGLANLVGTDTQEYRIRSTNSENLVTALQSQRDRISGVDLDEEATNLIAYQRGYQAAARFINVIDQLTNQLMTQLGS